MALQLVTRYHWRILSDDGLLNDPPILQHNWDDDNLNRNTETYRMGFHSPEEARNRLLQYAKRHQGVAFKSWTDYVLIEVTNIADIIE